MGRSFTGLGPGAADSLPWGSSMKVEPERFIDVDDERVLVLMHVTAEGESSGVPVERWSAHEYTIQDGVLTRIKVYSDRGDEIITENRVFRTMPGSDARISNPLLISWKFRDGKVIRVEQLGAGPDFRGALEAAGLSE